MAESESHKFPSGHDANGVYKTGELIARLEDMASVPTSRAAAHISCFEHDH